MKEEPRKNESGIKELGKTSKTIFVDMDETLLDNAKFITERTKATIRVARRSGHKIVPCTGACFAWHAPRCVGVDVDYMIASNGGAAYQMKNGTYTSVLWEEEISHDIVKKILHLGKGLCEVFILHAKDNWCNAKSEEEAMHFIKGRIITQITPQAKDFDRMVKFGELLQDFIKENDLRIANKAKVFLEEKFIGGESGWLFYDVVKEGVSKGSAIKRFCKMYDIDKKDTIAIGDGLNDVAMFKEAGFGVAMGNSLWELKSIANYVTDTNEEDGVAKFLENLTEL